MSDKLTAYERAYIATGLMLDRGIFPGPSKLNNWLHDHHSRNLNGVETRARADCLIAAGYIKHEQTGRWVLA